MTSLFGQKALFLGRKRLSLSISQILFSVASGVASGFITTTVVALPVNHLDAVVEHLEGIMTASVQVAEKPTIQVQMTTCQVNVPENDDSNSVFLYQEQGIVGRLDKPYRQRFLEITTSEEADNLVYSHSYKPSNLEQWTNFCNSETRTASQTQLGELICTVTLKPFLSVYAGKTQSGGCPAQVRGAVKITNQIVLHQDGMDTWDRGFDEWGNQVWGAKDRAYQFRR